MLDKSRATLAAKTNFVELLKGNIMVQEASFARDRKSDKVNLAEAKAMPKEAFTVARAPRNRPRDEVDQHYSVKEKHSVKVKKTQRDMSNVRVEFWILGR